MTPVEKVIAQIVKLCEEYHVKKAILFGSRAKGTALERSDIDIAVSGVPDYDGEIVKSYFHTIVNIYIDKIYEFKNYVDKVLGQENQ